MDLLRPCPRIFKYIAIIRQPGKSGILCIFLHHFTVQKIFCQGRLAEVGLIERLGTEKGRG